MIDSYYELGSYKDSNNKKFLLIIISSILLLILFSKIKINEYENFNLIKNDDSYYLLCDDNCDLPKKRHNFILGKKLYSYVVKNNFENMMEIKISEKIDIEDSKSIGIYIRKTSAINSLINIFKKKGVI